jgi:predicted enzyme related to lactoylglutathione lyase
MVGRRCIPAKPLTCHRLAEILSPDDLVDSWMFQQNKEITMKVSIAWFTVDDFEAAKKFYGNVLGMKKTFEMQTWAEFSDGEGDASIGIATNSRAGKEPGATVILEVDNIEGQRKRLESNGVKFEGAIEEIPGVVRMTTFRDPSGNRMQLCQPLMER